MSIELECLTFVTIASLNLKRGVTRGDSGGASVAASSARGAVVAREGVSPPHAREWRARRTPESMKRVFLDDLRARFDAQGYVVVENYLDADVVEACREELDAVLRCAREGAGVKIPIIRPAIRGN